LKKQIRILIRSNTESENQFFDSNDREKAKVSKCSARFQVKKPPDVDVKVSKLEILDLSVRMYPIYGSIKDTYIQWCINRG